MIPTNAFSSFDDAEVGKFVKMQQMQQAMQQQFGNFNMSGGGGQGRPPWQSFRPREPKPFSEDWKPNPNSLHAKIDSIREDVNKLMALAMGSLQPHPSTTATQPTLLPPPASGAAVIHQSAQSPFQPSTPNTPM